VTPATLPTRGPAAPSRHGLQTTPLSRPARKAGRRLKRRDAQSCGCLGPGYTPSSRIVPATATLLSTTRGSDMTRRPYERPCAPAEGRSPRLRAIAPSLRASYGRRCTAIPKPGSDRSASTTAIGLSLGNKLELLSSKATRGKRRSCSPG